MKAKFIIGVNMPTGPKAKKLTKDDVWGSAADNYTGMIVARSESKCPIFKDKVPYKSVTVVCDIAQQGEVEYWLEYVHGGNCVCKTKKLPENKIAIRSDYQCW